jgi:hypothetical protein
LRISPQPLPLFIALAIVVALTLVQYARFGTGTLLGWDSAYYVYLTTLIEDHGLGTMIVLWHYPHLYVVGLWAVGKALGDFTLAERLFPFVWLTLLLLLYQRISWNLARRPFISSLTVILAAVTLNTIRIYAELHRGLMALVFSYAVLIELSRRTTPLLQWNRSSVLIFLLLFAIAATHLETYATLAIALIGSAMFRRDGRRALVYVLFLSLPIAILSPLLYGFFVEYPLRIDVLTPPELVLDPATVLLFAAGSLATLPFAVMGGLYLFQRAKGGDPLAELLFSWTTGLVALFVIFVVGLVRLPAVRVLYLVPVPILLALSLPWIEERVRRHKLSPGAAGT